jgi:hypothetical protein
MSSACPCDDLPEPRVQIAAGLPALPRQIRSFPEVRQRLLDGISGKDALADWRAREGRDLGVMLLEMWAYVSDVLNFYDERIANETYLRTAGRDPSLRRSLRRLVEGLGYRPAPGAAGKAVLAAVADGRTGVTVPAGTGFRSGAFGGQPPQAFELDVDTPIHPFKNEWVIGPQRQGGAGPGQTQVFVSAGLGLARDRLALFEVAGPGGVTRFAHKVLNVASTPGKDGQTYAQVTFDSVVPLPPGVDPTTVKVRVPTVTAVLTRNHPDARPDSPIQPDLETLFLDSIYRQLRLSDPIIVARDAEGSFVPRVLVDVAEDFVFLKPPASPPGPDDIRIPVSRVTLDQALPRAAAGNQLTFHFAFVDAGTFTTVADPVIPARLLASLDGVPVNGIVERPPDANDQGEIKQDFLLLDADQQGVLAGGVMRFSADGRARFSADAASDFPDTLKAPISVFGNLLPVSRGESVFNEVLGSGDGTQANQQFKLRKKPLTYLIGQNPRDRKSTLSIRVDGILWSEIGNFFDAGSEDHVFIVRHDDNQETFVTFGDGVSGARLPSGVDNVVATYRFGSGALVPPAGSIEQIPRPFTGLRAVRDPAAASAGRDPESTEDLRNNAPKSALTFDRAVGLPDFQAVASLIAGVDRATAEFIWFDDQQRAGVDVSYIGQARESDVETVLRQDAEANLPIRVRKATGRVSTLSLSVAFDNTFIGDAVAAAVKSALTDPVNGLLAPANSEIGGRLWSSRLYRAVQDVAGVVAVQSVVLVVDGESLDLGGTDAVCTPAGTFLDFDNGNRVSVTATSPIGGIRQPKATTTVSASGGQVIRP